MRFGNWELTKSSQTKYQSPNSISWVSFPYWVSFQRGENAISDRHSRMEKRPNQVKPCIMSRSEHEFYMIEHILSANSAIVRGGKWIREWRNDPISISWVSFPSWDFFQWHENAISDRDSRMEKWSNQAKPRILHRGTAYCICNRRGKFSTNLSPSGRIRQVQNTTSYHNFCTMNLNWSRMVRGHAPYK